MRLSEDQKNDILSAFKDLLNFDYELYLIGSRTKDHLRGGDIDLLVITKQTCIGKFRKIKSQLINEIMKKRSIDDMRVDISVGTAQDLKTDPFFSTVDSGKIRLS